MEKSKSTVNKKTTPPKDKVEGSFVKYLPYSVGVTIVVIAVLVGVLISQKKVPPDKSADVSTPQPGVVVQQSYDGALAMKPIDQERYRQIIQKAWDRALVEGSTHVLRFPKDPELVGFRYSPDGSPTDKALVVYMDKPIILRTKKVLELPDGVASRITLSRENYQLVVLFEFTSAVSELDVGKVLEESFTQVIAGKAM